MSQPSEAFRPLFEDALSAAGYRVVPDSGTIPEDAINRAEQVSIQRDVRIMYRLFELMQTYGTERDQDIEQVIRESGLGDPAGGRFDDSRDAAIHRLVVTQFGGDATRLRDYVIEHIEPANVVRFGDRRPIPPPSQRPADPLFEVVELLETAAGKITDVSVLLSRAAQEIRKTL